MRRLSIFAAALAAAAVFPGAANAITCYTVLDRSDNTIYQDTQPPVDMSETGAADREASNGGRGPGGAARISREARRELARLEVGVDVSQCDMAPRADPTSTVPISPRSAFANAWLTKP